MKLEITRGSEVSQTPKDKRHMPFLYKEDRFKIRYKKINNLCGVAVEERLFCLGRVMCGILGIVTMV